MTPPFSAKVKGGIFALKGQKKSAFVAKMELLDLKIDVSISTINRLWKSKLIGKPGSMAVVLGMKRRKRKTVRTPEVIRKVKQMVQNDNPRTQLVMGKRVGVRPQRISEIIKEDLGLKRLKKHGQRLQSYSLKDNKLVEFSWDKIYNERRMAAKQP